LTKLLLNCTFSKAFSNSGVGKVCVRVFICFERKNGKTTTDMLNLGFMKTRQGREGE